jgi:hypothetical protein
MSLRKFEIRQANEFLETLVANATDGIVDAYVADLAEMAGMSRVQAQVGLRVLVERGRVSVERRGRRASPGRFRITSGEPVRWSEEQPSRVMDLQEGNRFYALPAELTELENGALRRENAALRERIALLEAQLNAFGRANSGLRENA